MRRILSFLFVLQFVLLSSLAFGQSRVLKGKVTSPKDPTGLPGVSVVIKGTATGTITDIDGNFSIEATTGNVLVLTFIGFETQEILVTDQVSMDVVMQEQANQLNEIVVVGYQQISKRDITGTVYTVSADKLKDISYNGMDQALQGQSPGVQVTQSSGTPGGGVSVHIRGATSILASNRPLYIVDGIPIATGALTSRDFGGQDDNALSMINTNDIESYTVLSDASAKAIYGSRASNGVIVITTKRGKTGKAKITLDVQHGFIDPVKKLDLMNSSQLLELQIEAVKNAKENPDSFGLIKGVTDAVNTDWQKAVLRTAILQQYQLNVSGGDDRTHYYIGAGWRSEEGIQLNNKFERGSLVMNFDHKMSEKLTLSTNLTLSRAFNKRVKGDNFLDGVYSGAVKSLPFNVPYDESGNIVGPSSPLYAFFPNFNPVGQALIPRFNTTTVKVLGNINITYSINDEFKFKAQASLDYNNIMEDQYENSQTAIGGYLTAVGGHGYGVFSTAAGSTFNSFATLSYAKTVAEKHQINAVLGTEVLKQNGQSSSVTGRQFASDDFTYIQSAGIVDEGFSQRDAAHGLLSAFFEGRYSYDDRILASASVRVDGSSNFGANHRFGYFPGVSAAWRISKEKFFHSQLISDLKIRTSFGLTGNERIPQFQFLALWGPGSYNGSSGLNPNNVVNPNIKWETTRELNTGIDISLLDGRIQSTANVYYNKTYDLLLSKPIASTSGFSVIRSNIGQMENKGVEFSVTSVNMEGKVRWTTTLNLSKNLNKVIFLADSTPIYAGYTGNGVDATNIVRKGYPLGSFFGLNFLGVNPATGNAMYQDVNKDGIISNADAVVIGNSQPKFIGGLTNRFQYKSFDLSIFFNFSVGNKVLNFTKASTVNMGADIQTNQSTDALRRWKKPGDITDVPKYEFGSSTNNLLSNRLLEDASYARLKNLSFGYTLPASISNRYKLDQVRVYVSATNLLTFTKYSGSDPEVSTLDGSTTAQGIDFFTLPQVRTISFGVNVTLK